VEKILNLSEEQQFELITELCVRTDLAFIYCKYALIKSNWDLDDATLFLKENGRNFIGK
jgi:translation elongation factor EF-Ts